MKAIVRRRYGGTDVLELADAPQPEIAADEVLVRVRAAGLDRGTWHLMTGLPLIARPAFGVRAPRNPVLGLDLAGVVEAVGDDVTRFSPGDEVLGIGKGSFATYAPALERKLVHKPATLSFVEAGVLAISGLTALQAVRDQARVRPGQRVLVIGASGGVGSYAVQVARAYGAAVTAVCGPAKAGLVRDLGAERVIDHTREDFAASGERWDAILDIAGNASLRRLRRALTPRGTLVIVGGEEGGRWLGGIDRNLRALLLSPFVGQRLTMFVSSESLDDLTALVALVEAGEVRPVVGAEYPLDRVPQALEDLLAGRARGKLAITL